jgi:site-specific DNA recombinase
MAEIYRERISALYERLQGDDGRSEAAEVLRTLVERVTLVPDENGLGIVLRGDLAAILSFAAGKKKPTSFRRPG